MPCFGWLRWIAIVTAIHRQVTVSLRRGTCTGRRQILSPEQKLPVSLPLRRSAVGRFLILPLLPLFLQRLLMSYKCLVTTTFNTSRFPLKWAKGNHKESWNSWGSSGVHFRSAGWLMWMKSVVLPSKLECDVSMTGSDYSILNSSLFLIKGVLEVT